MTVTMEIEAREYRLAQRDWLDASRRLLLYSQHWHYISILVLTKSVATISYLLFMVACQADAWLFWLLFRPFAGDSNTTRLDEMFADDRTHCTRDSVWSTFSLLCLALSLLVAWLYRRFFE